ncbi:DUF2911 domain-containing protein [Reichenbachiella agariperforans]|uniref:DUF2911 domain-containing protein n=1 Tax=Reichenbachiella agariperforans TaxID=156994 RepID=UPI001C09EBEB|nr:DUF2911 domain-containing protein [Reichenbachiella agariperforans]MBU2915264.1 DUF2911 domain-containing protein [Reichenbachiella agariperforans]
MLKKILWVLGSVVILFGTFVMYGILTTKQHSPPGLATFTQNDLNIKVDYCRPFKKGRDVFGDLLPYDTYWRTGANEPTIISFGQDVVFGGETVKAGSYRLYTVPGQEMWTVVLNSELEKWGYWEPDPALDVLRVEVPSETYPCCQEQFVIQFPQTEQGTEMVLIWDDVQVKVPITS